MLWKRLPLLRPYLIGKDLGFTPVKRYATKLAKTLLHNEAAAAQKAGVA